MKKILFIFLLLIITFLPAYADFYTYKLYNPITKNVQNVNMAYARISENSFLITFMNQQNKQLCFVDESKTYKKNGITYGKCLNYEVFLRTGGFASENEEDWFLWQEYKLNTYYREVSEIQEERIPYGEKLLSPFDSSLKEYKYKLYDSETKKGFTSVMGTFSSGKYYEISFESITPNINKTLIVIPETIKKKDGLLCGQCYQFGHPEKIFAWREYYPNTFYNELFSIIKERKEQNHPLPINKIYLQQMGLQ